MQADSSFNSRFFNNKGNHSKDDSHKDDKDEKSKNIKQPTILLKNRDRNEDRSVSPRRNTKESEPVITIATPAPAESILLYFHSFFFFPYQNLLLFLSAQPAMVKQMTKSLKLIDDGVLYSEGVQEYLQENNDFIVVGVVGGQGVGKSTVLNLLSQSSVTEKMKKTLFNHKDIQKDENGFENIKILTENIADLNLKDLQENIVFKIEDTQDLEANSNSTYGIDMYVTKDRVCSVHFTKYLEFVYNKMIAANFIRFSTDYVDVSIR